MSDEIKSTETTPAVATETVAEPVAMETNATEPVGTREDLDRLLSDGRKALLVDNLEEACDKLGEAAALSVKLFGDFAAEAYEPYFYYGKALITLASAEKDVIESKLQDDSVVEGLKEGLMTLAETLAEQQKGEQQEAVKETGDAVEPMEQTDEAESKKDESAVESEIDADQTLKEGEEVEDEEDEEAETAQLAFEILDCARVICEKNTDNSSKWLERQKDTFILLSQVALNGDNFATAIEDLNGALKIVDTHFPQDFREASFIHLELGRINRKAGDFSSANSHIEKSISSLEQFKAKLQSEPLEGITSADVDGMLEELLDEQSLNRIKESENKENASAQPTKTDDKPAETIQIKRKEKRAAEDAIDGSVDLKKSKVGDAANEA